MALDEAGHLVAVAVLGRQHVVGLEGGQRLQDVDGLLSVHAQPAHDHAQSFPAPLVPSHLGVVELLAGR